MDAGKLNKRLSFMARDAGYDDAGGPVNTWTESFKRWANVRYLSGIETARAGAEVSVARGSIRVRRCSDITPGMRAVLGSTTFEIKAVLQDEEGLEFTALAFEVVT